MSESGQIICGIRPWSIAPPSYFLTTPKQHKRPDQAQPCLRLDLKYLELHDSRPAMPNLQQSQEHPPREF